VFPIVLHRLNKKKIKKKKWEKTKGKELSSGLAYILYIYAYKVFRVWLCSFFTRVEIHATAFRFDKFGSYIKMLKRSSRSVRRQRYRVRGMKNPCNLYPFWNAFYYHYNNILYCVHRRRRRRQRRRGPTASRNVFSLYIIYPRVNLRGSHHQNNDGFYFICLFSQIDHVVLGNNKLFYVFPLFVRHKGKKVQNYIFYIRGRNIRIK